MKKVLMIVLLMVGITAIAQKGEKGEKERHEHMQNFTPEQVATLRTKKATLALDLTEVQQGQMKAVFLENAKMRKNKMEERKAKKENGDIKKPTPEERYTKANARLDAQIAQKTKIKSILTDVQFEKWEKMKHHKGKGRKKKGDRKKGSKTE